MKAIIVAAGMGRRLAPYTDDRPKCMVPVAGKPILAHQVDALRAHGVGDILVVRGYLGDRITLPGLRFCENPRFRENNILGSLMYAGDELEDDFLFSYSDIVYHPSAVAEVLATPGAGALVVDRKWAEAYVGRTEHPVSEAELTRVDHGRVTRVGKRAVPEADAVGEFIGLARFSRELGALVRAEHRTLERTHAGKPFGLAQRFEVAYLTDMFNHLIDTRGVDLRPAFIDGTWREIDTTQDLARAEQVVAWRD
jgi:choline kinase